jgi:hypothetical protein
LENPPACTLSLLFEAGVIPQMGYLRKVRGSAFWREAKEKSPNYPIWGIADEAAAVRMSVGVISMTNKMLRSRKHKDGRMPVELRFILMGIFCCFAASASAFAQHPSFGGYHAYGGQHTSHAYGTSVAGSGRHADQLPHSVPASAVADFTPKKFDSTRGELDRLERTSLLLAKAGMATSAPANSGPRYTPKSAEHSAPINFPHQESRNGRGAARTSKAR